MHFLAALLLVLFSAVLVSATPVPFNDIEKRWAQGQNDREIHSGLTHRDMTPAWPIARDSSNPESGGFARATDSRSIAQSELSRRSGGGGSLLRKMREFPAEIMSGVERRGGVELEAPVLRPKKAMKYYFSK